MMVCKPAGLSYVFPEGWHVTCHVFTGWEASKDSRYLVSPTEGGLYSLVIESERRRGVAVPARARRTA